MASDIKGVIERLARRVGALGPDSLQLKKAFTLIGIRLQADTMLNIRKNRLIDKGRLLNSIRFELFKKGTVSGVSVGSYAVPYASVHEFGFNGSVNIRAYARTMNSVFGRKVDPRKVLVRPHSRHMRIPARPYLRPAVRANNAYIIDTLRAALNG
jgi:phage gpG-like protein